MNAPELLRAYLAKIQDPAAVAALFADDGVLELPQMNVRIQGRAEIEKFIAGLLKMIPDFRFRDIHVLIETPDQAFGAYSIEAVVRRSARSDGTVSPATVRSHAALIPTLPRIRASDAQRTRESARAEKQARKGRRAAVATTLHELRGGATNGRARLRAAPRAKRN